MIAAAMAALMSAAVPAVPAAVAAMSPTVVTTATMMGTLATMTVMVGPRGVGTAAIATTVMIAPATLIGGPRQGATEDRERQDTDPGSTLPQE